MYLDFYRMRTDPFSRRPLLDWYFESQAHRKAWTDLSFALCSGESLVVIHGEPGTGKTTTSLRMLRLLRHRVDGRMAYLSGSAHKNYSEIIRALARKISLPTDEDDSRIEYSIFRHFSTLDGKSFHLVIDDADQLALEDLERLDLLTDLHHGDFYPVQLTLFGGQDIVDTLHNPALRSLDRRIRRCSVIRGLGQTETPEYIYFRLYKSGSPGIPSFQDKAVRSIFEFSSGNPGHIHTLCRTSLDLGARYQAEVIDDFIVDRAIEVLSTNTETDPVIELKPELKPESKPEPSHTRNLTLLSPFNSLLKNEHATPSLAPSETPLAPIEWEYDAYMRMASNPIQADSSNKNKHLRTFILLGGLLLVSMLAAILFNVTRFLKGIL